MFCYPSDQVNAKLLHSVIHGSGSLVTWYLSHLLQNAIRTAASIQNGLFEMDHRNVLIPVLVRQALLGNSNDIELYKVVLLTRGDKLTRINFKFKHLLHPKEHFAPSYSTPITGISTISLIHFKYCEWIIEAAVRIAFVLTSFEQIFQDPSYLDQIF